MTRCLVQRPRALCKSFPSVTPLETRQPSSRPITNTTRTRSRAASTSNPGGGPDEVDLDFHDRDVVLSLSLDHTTIRLLHLQNVRSDTVAAARAAVDDFLHQVKLADERRGTVWPGREAHTISEAYDEIHPALCDYVEEKAQERGLPFDWSHGGLSRDTFRKAFSQPIYRVRICEDGAVGLTTGGRGVPPWRK